MQFLNWMALENATIVSPQSWCLSYSSDFGGDDYLTLATGTYTIVITAVNPSDVFTTGVITTADPPTKIVITPISIILSPLSLTYEVEVLDTLDTDGLSIFIEPDNQYLDMIVINTAPA